MAKGCALPLIAFLILFSSQPTGAQQDQPEQAEPEENERSIRNYFDLYTHDPQELQEFWREAEKRRRLFGPMGLRGYFIPPGHEPGPYLGPPLQIWGRGSGTTLWRNPITGWPIQ